MLKAVDLPIVSNEKCQEMHRGNLLVTSSKICAGGRRNEGVCEVRAPLALILFPLMRCWNILTADLRGGAPQLCSVLVLINENRPSDLWVIVRQVKVISGASQRLGFYPNALRVCESPSLAARHWERCITFHQLLRPWADGSQLCESTAQSLTMAKASDDLAAAPIQTGIMSFFFFVHC